MAQRHTNRKKLTVPFCPEFKDEKAYYKTSTAEEKTVCNYTKIDFMSLRELDIFAFWQYLRDAVIYNLSLTDKGKEYLEKAYLYEKNRYVDKPDRAALAEFL